MRGGFVAVPKALITALPNLNMPTLISFLDTSDSLSFPLEHRFSHGNGVLRRRDRKNRATN